MGSELLDVGPLEIVVLGILNSESQQSVGDVQVKLKQAGHDLAYTTVMTVLVRLTQKNLVAREKSGRQFLYSASKKKSGAALNIFTKVKNSLFQSQRLSPILNLLEVENDLTTEELQELKAAVEARLRKKESKK